MCTHQNSRSLKTDSGRSLHGGHFVHYTVFFLNEPFELGD